MFGQYANVATNDPGFVWTGTILLRIYTWICVQGLNIDTDKKDISTIFGV